MNKNNRLDDGCVSQESGSIISCENQTLGEEIPILGTPFGLRYESDRVPGRAAKPSITVKFRDGKQNPPPARVLIDVAVAGQHIHQEYSYSEEKPAVINWNGLDGFGRPVQGVQDATVRVGYVYNAQYYTSKEAFDAMFAQTAGEGYSSTLEPVKSADGSTVTLWRSWKEPLGVLNAQPLGFGGWTFTHQHLLDPSNGLLYRGDGQTLKPSILGPTIRKLASGQISGVSPSSGFLQNAMAPLPDGCVVLPFRKATGTLYSHLVKVCADGQRAFFAGKEPKTNCHKDAEDDQGETFCSDINALASSPDGNTIVVGEHSSNSCNWRIRRLRRQANGNWWTDTIAGNEKGDQNSPCEANGDGMDAKAATFASISALAFGYDGSLYIRDKTTVRRLLPDGRIVRVAGKNKKEGLPNNGAVAVDALLPSESTSRAFGVDALGRIYLTADVSQKRAVFRVDTDGVIRHIAGGGTNESITGAYAATEAYLGKNSLNTLSVDAEGNVALLHLPKDSTDKWVLRVVDVGGTIRTVVAGGTGTKDGGLAFSAMLNTPEGLAWGPKGSLYVIDSTNNTTLRLISPVSPSLTGTEMVVPDASGRELYVFSSAGRHERTVDALTGITRWKMGYSNGLLSSVTDVDARSTTITRSADGKTVLITSPDGLQTRLVLDGNGWAKTVDYPSAKTGTYASSYPTGVGFSLEHQSDGLLTAFTTPTQKTSKMKYDAGRLIEDTEPSDTGGSKTLTLAQSNENSWQVNVQTADKRLIQYLVSYDSAGNRTRQRIAWDGSKTTTIERLDGTVESTSPTAVTTAKKSPDVLLGMAAPSWSSVNVQLPSKKTVEMTMTQEGSFKSSGDMLSGMNRTTSVLVNGKGKGSWAYDATSRKLTVSGPKLSTGNSLTSTVELNDKGRASKVTFPRATKPAELTYDEAGRLTSVKQGNRTFAVHYNSAGFIDSVNNPLSQQTSIDSDGLGRPRQITAPGLPPMSMTPDQNGNLLSLTPPNGNAHHFGYDGQDRQKTYTPPTVAAGRFNVPSKGFRAGKAPDEIGLSSCAMRRRWTAHRIDSVR